MMANPMLRSSPLERIGLCASFLCAVHCMVMPLVLAAQPLFHWFKISRVADNAMLTLAASVGLMVGWRGLRRHRDFGPLVLLFVGLTAVGIGRVFVVPALIMGGPLVMSYALWLNRRLCRCETCRH
jgi:hypothetical protein